MLAEQLKQFDAIVVEKIKAELPTNRKTVEEYLFLFAVNYTHLVSMLWSRSTTKVTDSYAQYLAELCIENLLMASHKNELSIDEVVAAIEDYYNQLEAVKEKELDAFYISSLVLNDESMRDPVFQCAFIIKAIEIKYNLSMDAFLEHYKNWQKDK